MFKCDESNEVFNWLNDNWGDEETMIDVIGTLCINEYQGIYTPQVTVKNSIIVGV